MKKEFSYFSETADVVKEKMFATIDAIAIPRNKVEATPKLVSFTRGNDTYEAWVMPLERVNGLILNVIYYLGLSEELITIEAGKILFKPLPFGAEYKFGMIGVRYNVFGNLENVLWRPGEKKAKKQAAEYYGMEADSDFIPSSEKMAAV